MTHPDEYQAFVQHVMRDMSLLGKQYKAFEELRSTLETLRASAPHDPEAARRLEKLNALDNDDNFQALCSQAEKDLRTINRQIDGLNKQLDQAESTQTAPAPQVKPVEQEVRAPRKPHKPQFV